MEEDEEPLMRCSLVVGNLLFGVGDLLVSSLGHLGFTVINGEFMLHAIAGCTVDSPRAHSHSSSICYSLKWSMVLFYCGSGVNYSPISQMFEIVLPLNVETSTRVEGCN